MEKNMKGGELKQCKFFLITGNNLPWSKILFGLRSVSAVLNENTILSILHRIILLYIFWRFLKNLLKKLVLWPFTLNVELGKTLEFSSGE